ncbi:MAG: LuxR C-terminal-related transcriptional regulator [Terriglobia bacterium]
MSRLKAIGGKPCLIRVTITDSTPMGAQLLADALRRSHRFGTVQAAHRTSDFLAAVAGDPPDVAVVSANFEGDTLGGFKLAQELGAAHRGVKVVMMFDAPGGDSVVQAFRNGCQGVFCRKRSVKELIKCITCVHAGQIWGNSEELGFVLEALREPRPLRVVNTAGVALLTQREMAVVQCVAEGLTNREAAEQLNLSEHTVKNYMFRIFDKLGVSSRVELILHVANQMQTAAGFENGKRLSESCSSPETGHAAGPRAASGGAGLA